jgi:hypothetical protein
VTSSNGKVSVARCRAAPKPAVEPAAGLAAPALLSGPAWAQAGGGPNKPIRLIHFWAAGGAGNIGVRLLAEKMQAELDRPVVVENRPAAHTQQDLQLVDGHAVEGFCEGGHGTVAGAGRVCSVQL